MLEEAGIEPLDVRTDIKDMKVFELPQKNGGKVYNLANYTEMEAETEFLGRYKMECAVHDNVLIWENEKGELSGLMNQGTFYDGDSIIVRNDPYAYIFAQDSVALENTARAVILPTRPGYLKLLAKHDFAEPVIEFGQIIDGKWSLIESVPAAITDGYVNISITNERRNAIVLLGDKADMPAFEAAIVKTLCTSGV